MISPQFKRIIYRIIPFGLIWLVFGLIYALLEKGILGDFTYYPSTGNPYEFGGSIILFVGIVAITGLLQGTFEILYLNQQFIQQSLSRKIIYKTLIYLGMMVSFLLVLATIGNSVTLETGLFDKQVLNNVWTFFSNFAFWSVLFYIAAVIGLSLFYLEVSDNIGREVLNNFFTGKYHKPLEEDRIFMFLDMKSSTTIAEKLGHVKYFEMLKEYYADLSEPIIQHRGEIYQYVGDEIIVSWKLKSSDNNDCLRCFFAMRQGLREQAEKYQNKFGVSPSFKAGLHYGQVTTGEIGTIKKDIIFTGDVLNTTSRIQGLCNNYGVDNLVSGHLLKKIDLDPQFQFRKLGETELRGKGEKVTLFSVLV